MSKHLMDLPFCFLLPWCTEKDFILYVLDHMNKKFNVIYRSPLPEWCEDIPYIKKYELAIAYFYKKYIAAMNVNSPGWNQDIYRWKFTCEKGIVEDKKGFLQATWFCNTCLRGRVPEAKFVRMNVLCAKTSSSMFYHQTRTVIENCFLRM